MYLCYVWGGSMEELLDYVMSFTAEGENLDCAHPAQPVLDYLCGDNASTYATEVETFFEAYSEMRGIKSKAFKPMTACAHGSVATPYRGSCFICPRHSSLCTTFPHCEPQAIDASSCDDTLKLPWTVLKWLCLLYRVVNA